MLVILEAMVARSAIAYLKVALPAGSPDCVSIIRMSAPAQRSSSLLSLNAIAAILRCSGMTYGMRTAITVGALIGCIAIVRRPNRNFVNGFVSDTLRSRSWGRSGTVIATRIGKTLNRHEIFTDTLIASIGCIFVSTTPLTFSIGVLSYSAASTQII